MKHRLSPDYRKLLILIILAVAIRLFSLNQQWVEWYYSTGLYEALARVFRFSLQWIPFSIGDLLYLAAGIFLLVKTWKFFRLLFTGRLRQYLTANIFIRYINSVLIIYILFSLFWGLNYFRQSIAEQLNIKPVKYGAAEIRQILPVLHQRLNLYAGKIDSLERLKLLDRNVLTDQAKKAYQRSAEVYPIFQYAFPSVKSSIYSFVGHYFGFTGYFNPFTSEAQLNTTVPVYVRPFIIAHEIGHQLGYAREDEASFVAYLSCRHSGNPYFLYSIYFELYRSAAGELKNADADFVQPYNKSLAPRVQMDMQDFEAYLQQFKNGIEPFISGIYDKYLKMNNQPKGKATYNHVLALVMGYALKHGEDAL